MFGAIPAAGLAGWWYLTKPSMPDTLDASVSSLSSPPSVHSSLFPPSETIEDILAQHLVVENRINPAGNGNVYLIGWQHAKPEPTAAGRVQNLKEIDPLVPVTYAEIYNALRELALAHRLDLVIGEGIGPREFKYPTLKTALRPGEYEIMKTAVSTNANAAHFFRVNPAQTPYSALEFFHPDLVVTRGVAEMDLIGQVDPLYQRRWEVLQAAKKLLTIVGKRETPLPSFWDTHGKLEGELARIEEQEWEIHAKRSCLYVKELPRHVARYHAHDSAIIIGRRHLPIIEATYSGPQTLWVLHPPSLPEYQAPIEEEKRIVAEKLRHRVSLCPEEATKK